MKPFTRRMLFPIALALALCVGLAGCAARQAIPAAQVLVDGGAWPNEGGKSLDGTRVVIALDGRTLIELPFDQPHTVLIRQPDGAENEVALTGTAVYMARANCKNQDCVHMSEVTRENLELRAMGGFIICLPHRLSVEVRED